MPSNSLGGSTLQWGRDEVVVYVLCAALTSHRVYAPISMTRRTAGNSTTMGQWSGSGKATQSTATGQVSAGHWAEWRDDPHRRTTRSASRRQSTCYVAVRCPVVIYGWITWPSDKLAILKTIHLPSTVNFSALNAFKRSIVPIDFSLFLKCATD